MDRVPIIPLIFQTNISVATAKNPFFVYGWETSTAGGNAILQIIEL